MTIKVKLLEPIEGYSDIAEYRDPRTQEPFIVGDGPVRRLGYDMTHPRLVLTPLPKWRPATLEDGIRAIKGEVVRVRVKEYPEADWLEYNLATVWPGTPFARWGVKSGGTWAYCEVLDV